MLNSDSEEDEQVSNIFSKKQPELKQEITIGEPSSNIFSKAPEPKQFTVLSKTSSFIGEETKMFERQMSISRPSVMSDILTEDDNMFGYLEKQSPSFHKRWQKRMFVLTNKTLKYFKTETDYYEGKPPKGVLNFQQIWIEPTFEQQGFRINL